MARRLSNELTQAGWYRAQRARTREWAALGYDVRRERTGRVVKGKTQQAAVECWVRKVGETDATI